MTDWRSDSQRRRSRRRMQSGAGNALGVMVVLFLVVVAFIGCTAAVKSTQKQVTFKVEDKTVKRTHDKDEYLIFTNKGVFKNTDSWLYMKFRSSDLYAKLQRGEWYTCKVYGWRAGLTSSYPNLVSCEVALRTAQVG